MKVDIRVPVGRPLPELATFIKTTERLTLFPATSNPVTRHPLILASSVNSLAEIAPGRIMLTLAPGFLSVEKAGKPQARRAQLGETVTVIRELLAGRVATMDGHEMHLNNTSVNPPKVFVLAAGPKMLELAGEVADGVLMLVGLDPRSIEAAREHVRFGEARAGRPAGSVEEIFIVPTAIEDFATAREWPRRFFRPGKSFLTYPSKANLHWLRAAGIDLADDHDPISISPARAEKICDAFGLFGPPEYCAERLLRAKEESGVEHVFFFPSHTVDTAYDLPQADVEAFHKVIGPRLKAS